MINIANNDIIDITVVRNPVNKVYFSNNLVWEKNNLPYDAQVEWIATDGKAYINTGIKPTHNTRFEIVMNIPEITQSTWFFGARNGFANGQSALFYDLTAKWSWRFGSKDASNTTSIIEGTITFDNHTSGSARQLYIKYNNTRLSLVAANNTFTCNYPFYIFLMNINGGASTGNCQKGLSCISAKFWSGSTLIRDYIPVRKNGVGYLYDNVSGEFYGNANSIGAFTYGNDIV